MGRQLDEVIAEFNQLTARRLSGINPQLKIKKIDALEVLKEEEWQKGMSDSGTGGSAPATRALHAERD